MTTHTLIRRPIYNILLIQIEEIAIRDAKEISAAKYDVKLVLSQLVLSLSSYGLADSAAIFALKECDWTDHNTTVADIEPAQLDALRLAYVERFAKELRYKFEEKVEEMMSERETV